MIQLYTQILSYQAQVVCQLMRHTIKQYARDVIKRDDWTKLLSDIKKTESSCREFSHVVDAEILNRALDEQRKDMDKLYQSLIEKWQATTHELVVEYKQDRQEKRTRRQIEEDLKCLRALRTLNYEDYKARNPDRVPGTCQWLLKNDKYLK